MYDNILQAVGNTPILRLAHLDKGLPGSVWIKLENRNPGGSIKDRVARHLIRSALCDGSVKPGGTVVEATSGNMGIGIALVSRAMGLKAVLTMPESMSIERRKLIAAFGAEVVLTPAAKGMSGAVAESKKIAQERGGFIVGQFTNPRALEAHYTTTGPEILEATGGRIDVLLAGVGSGSSLCGAGRFLKERIPGVRLIAVEPALSPVLSGGKSGSHPIQGIGAGFIPEIVDVRLFDEILTVEGDEAIATARRLLAVEGVSAGISTGANVCMALKVAARPEMEGRRIVTFACDTGERYLSTALFNF